MLNGAKRGLELVVVYIRAWRWATRTQNEAAITHLVKIGSRWHEELTGVGIEAKKWSVQVGLWTLLVGKDPFIDSREMLRSFLVQYPDAR